MNGIWDLKTAKKKHRYDEKLANRILERFQPNKFADLGCGVGQYCAIFKENGWPVVHGYEGTLDITSIGIYDDILTIDLTKTRWVDIDYDLVMCLEVGEHIPVEKEQVFINNICRYTTKGLILSWAIPGQGGTGHVNERTNDYIVNEFTKRGFQYFEELSNDLRKHSSLKWFRKTIMVFKNG